MPKFEDEIYGMIPQDVWLQTGFRVDRPNDPIDGLFGDEKTDNLTARWQTIANEYQIPVMAHFHGFDTESNKTFRIPVDTHNIEKGLIKVKINQSERMRELTRNGVTGDQEMFNYILDDGQRLVEQVITRTKVAKNELLSTGKVTIKENNLDLTVDYGVPEANTSLELVVNDDTDVPEELQKIVDTATDNGVTLTGIVTSRQVITKLRGNKSLQTAINGNLSQGTLLRRSEFDAFLSEEYGINSVITNDLLYGASAALGADGRPSITQKRYFPKDKISFYGTADNMSRLGVGLWGDPPEAVGIQNRTGAAASGQSPYVYVTQWIENDPAELWTRASALFMPVLFDPNSLYVATVTDSATGA